jgi:AbrB family looped-hinge helix DNA binding protein
MYIATSKVTSKGQIVIPKKIREKYGIHPSTSVRWIEKKEGILMVPDAEDPIIAARGMLKGSGVLKAYQKDKETEKKRAGLKKQDRKQAAHSLKKLAGGWSEKDALEFAESIKSCEQIDEDMWL